MFSTEWEEIFKAKTHMSIWPWSDLVSYVSRYAKPDQEFQRVLELGCGVGANIPFFIKRGSAYSAVEGSLSAVSHVHAMYPQLAESIVCGDFTAEIPFSGPFDLVIDRVALPHNSTKAISRSLAMIYRLLREGGKFIGIDWFSSLHEDFGRGTMVDTYTRRDIESAAANGVGEVHFFDHEHLRKLLVGSGFEIERLEHKVSNVLLPQESHLAWWNFVAVKK
jgi:SAM-dependent methyltransferase